jgi:hypothetical protein
MGIIWRKRTKQSSVLHLIICFLLIFPSVGVILPGMTSISSAKLRTQWNNPSSTDQINQSQKEYLKNITIDDVFVNRVNSYYMNYPNQCIVIDGLVYIVTCYSKAFVIINARNPAHLTEISHTVDSTYLSIPRDIAVTNDSNYCYIITYEKNSHLTMWDISNKFFPQRVNQTMFSGETGMSCIMDPANNYLYVCTKSEVRIFNITNKENYQMDLMSTFHTGMNDTRQIWLATPYKNTVYVSNYGTGDINGYGEFVYDISNKASPSYVQTLNATYKTNLGCPVYTYRGYDYFIYVARHMVNNAYYRGYIECWNVSSDPNHPTFMWSKDTLGADGSKDNFSEGGIAIKNGLIFVGQANQNDTKKKVGINVWNATNIERRPTYMFHIGYGGSPYYMTLEHELEFDRNGSATTLFGLSQNDDALVALHLNWWGTPPSPPTIEGPRSGLPGESYNYTFISDDPEGDKIFYEINWGDGTINDWFGPVEPNVPLIKNHIWETKGIYTIKARAKNTHGAISEWGSMSMIMPIDTPLVVKHPFLSFLQRLFARFPGSFPLLRYLLMQ